ncbi:hypothetical protein DYBT9275_02563 [Dyadobacter sp. CECT 9275]|uniref:HTH araC/xylS-type domain-containing protein n=1 Tax=Dyadobacter helix TaxID=2822344 RepID=A0A916JCV4_9BACT|nr:helix-turn-helix domain-containing protein [Dyadobacter sp. CECT 9275]CAG5000943.1 hypothetical protein DYBT9275_02563 [Dyadobacter sp. CECT 9275]
MRTQLYAILPQLQPYVRSICTMECDGEADWSQVRVLPDACVELFLNYTDTPIAMIAGQLYRRSIISCRISRPAEVQMRKGSGCLAICFHPGMAYPFVQMPMYLFKDTTVNFFDIGNNMATELEEKLADLPDHEKRISMVQEFLLAQLKYGRQDLQVTYCLNQVQHSHRAVTVSKLAAETGLSQRQLVRKFQQSVGLSPKEYLGVCRFINSLQYLEKYPCVSLTEVAYLSGYYDQAHFIRDYKHYAGCSPGKVATASHILF